MSEDKALYLAISTKSGELVTRENRPLYATRDLWESLTSMPVTVIPTAANGLPFAALPLMDRGAPDIVGKLFNTLTALTKVTEMAAQRIEILDRVIAEKAATPDP